MLTWPSTLPPPQPDDYSLRAINVTDHTDFEQGAYRARRLAMKAPHTGDVSWLCNKHQSRLLRHFTEVATNQRADAFLWPVYVDDLFHTQRVMLTEPVEFKYVGFQKWRATSKFYVIDDLGPSLWATVSFDDIRSGDGNHLIKKTLGTLSKFKGIRVDAFVRDGFNGPDAEVAVGFTGTPTAFLNTIACATSGVHLEITPTHDHAGTSLYLGTEYTESKDITVSYQDDTDATAGEMAVIFSYEVV